MNTEHVEGLEAVFSDLVRRKPYGISGRQLEKGGHGACVRLTWHDVKLLHNLLRWRLKPWYKRLWIGKYD